MIIEKCISRSIFSGRFVSKSKLVFKYHLEFAIIILLFIRAPRKNFDVKDQWRDKSLKKILELAYVPPSSNGSLDLI